MNPTTAILLAGGKGTRFRTGRTDKDAIKVMLPVNDRPVLEWNLRILRDQMNIRSVVMIVGSHKEVIQEYFGDGRKFGLEISYLESNPDSDLPTALMLAKDSVSGPFVLMLGDTTGSTWPNSRPTWRPWSHSPNRIIPRRSRKTTPSTSMTT
jgi:NDP-sugar pyrophosphorylase family protein